MELRRIDLSNNQLDSIPNTAFDHLVGKLRHINVIGNRFAEDAVSGLGQFDNFPGLNLIR